MQLRDLVLPSPRVLHLHVCLAAGLPFFHYPIPVRSLLWSSLGTPPCHPSSRTLEHPAQCSQLRSQRGFQEQCSPPVTQHTGDSSAHPFRSFLTVKGPSSWPASLTLAVPYSGSSPARVQASPQPGATGGFCPYTGVALPRGLLRQHGRPAVLHLWAFACGSSMT